MTIIVVKCKICDVREYQAARLCAEQGADFLGMHCIWGIKSDREGALREIAERFPTEFPSVSLVVVTRQTFFVDIAEILTSLSPSYIQLHSPEWSGDELLRFRDQVVGRENGTPQIIAVEKVPSSPERIQDLCRGADLLLLDRTQYGIGHQPGMVPELYYREAVLWASDAGISCLIAGGLTPENVRQYIESVRPWGVDVQRGVEKIDQRGYKDTAKLRAFIAEVRRAG